jgi:aminoglycoside phosphotransferase family enzyme
MAREGNQAMLTEPALALPTLADKIAYLSRPETYADGTSAVEVIETHMSYVFLVDRLVYKLKKPVCYPFLDFSTLEARRFNCEEELRLNRRLARNVYLAVVPLTVWKDGLRLAGPGPPVEWLVQMRRLPRHLMLDRAIRETRVSEQDVARFTRVLALFYRDGERIAITPAAYRERLRKATADNHQALCAPAYELDAAMLRSMAKIQLEFLDAHAGMFDERVHRIVEGHGDLRPEHVCLAGEPVFIDCLEFNRDLRIVDPADELSSLAMECELLGAGDLGRLLFDTYESVTGDAPGIALTRFHQSQRSLLRAKLAVWHLEDGVSDETRTKWLARTEAYLRLGEVYCSRL